MSVRIIQGDCRAMLATLPDASVQCCVTSPPYLGLRDYGTATWDGGDPACDHTGVRREHGDHEKQSKSAGTSRDPVSRNCRKCGARRIDAQIGLEASPDAYIAEMVAVFREVRRVLRDDGVMFLNLGDSYNNRTKVRTSSHQPALNDFVDDNWAERAARGGVRMSSTEGGIKEKDLLMMPARLAIALQADGWWVRSQLPWVKRSTMPESCTDRPTSAIEYVYLFTKSGASTYWVHRDKPGSRTQPKPDYRWVHHKTREEMSVMPADWDTHEHVRKLWRRINLWEGRDYFWDAVAVARQGATEPHAPGNRTRTQPIAKGSRDPALSSDRAWGSATRNFRNSDLFFDSLNAPYGLICDADGNPLALDVNPAAFSDWTDSMEYVPVESTQDLANSACAPSDDTIRKVSPDCPMHGDPSAQVSNSFYGGRTDEYHSGRSERTGDCLSQEQLADSAPIATRLSSEIEASMSGSTHQQSFLSATLHSNETHRTGRVPETSPAYTPSAETFSHTADKPSGLSLFGSVDHKRVSRTSGCSSSDSSTTGMASGNADKLDEAVSSEASSALQCTCVYYKKTTKKTSHFATFPPALVEPLVRAGTSERGCCANCGAPWVRQTETMPEHKLKQAALAAIVAAKDSKEVRMASGRVHVRADMSPVTTTGWLASCQCNASVVPCTVLDPFAGAFTAPMVADRLQRNAIGIELSETYCQMARNRLIQDAGLFAELA